MRDWRNKGYSAFFSSFLSPSAFLLFLAFFSFFGASAAGASSAALAIVQEVGSRTAKARKMIRVRFIVSLLGGWPWRKCRARSRKQRTCHQPTSEQHRKRGANRAVARAKL